MDTQNPQTNGALIRQDFSGKQVEQRHETAAIAVAAQAKAQVEARYLMALQRPRDLDVSRQKLLADCKRPGFARTAIYSVPRAGGRIEGPSIRMAEAAARAMTNLLTESAIVFEDERKQIVRVMVTDLEANLTYDQDITIEKLVERRDPKKGEEVLGERINSTGAKVFLCGAREDDLTMKRAALVSKAARTLILRMVPGDILEDAVAQVKQVMRDADAKDPEAARKAVFDGFAEVGIDAAALKEFLGHDRPKLTETELEELRGAYAAVRDGLSSWDSIMEGRRLERGQAKKEAAAAPVPAASTNPAEVENAIIILRESAESVASLSSAAEKLPEAVRTHPEVSAEYAKLRQAITTKKAAK
jgi:hypothetical protein